MGSKRSMFNLLRVDFLCKWWYFSGKEYYEFDKGKYLIIEPKVGDAVMLDKKHQFGDIISYMAYVREPMPELFELEWQ